MKEILHISRNKETYLITDIQWQRYVEYFFKNTNLYYKNKFFYQYLNFAPRVLQFDDDKKMIIREYIQNSDTIDFFQVWKLMRDIEDTIKMPFFAILDYEDSYKNNIFYDWNYFILRLYNRNSDFFKKWYISHEKYLQVRKSIYNFIRSKKKFHSSLAIRDFKRENIVFQKNKVYLFDFDEIEFWDINMGISDLFSNINQDEIKNFLYWYWSIDEQKYSLFCFFSEFEEIHNTIRRDPNYNLKISTTF